MHVVIVGKEDRTSVCLVVHRVLRHLVVQFDLKVGLVSKPEDHHRGEHHRDQSLYNHQPVDIWDSGYQEGSQEGGCDQSCDNYAAQDFRDSHRLRLTVACHSLEVFSLDQETVVASVTQGGNPSCNQRAFGKRVLEVDRAALHRHVYVPGRVHNQVLRFEMVVKNLSANNYRQDHEVPDDQRYEISYFVLQELSDVGVVVRPDAKLDSEGDPKTD